MLKILAANTLPLADIILFVALGAIVAISVAVYFLIPVFNKKQYQEQRDNLRKREESFKASVNQSNEVDVVADAADAATEQEPTKEPEQTSDNE